MQSDFTEAVAWWVATGINSKMLAEYEAQYGSTSKFWTRLQIHGNRPLRMSHVVLAFILLCFTLILSLVVFVTELWFGKKEQGVGGRRDKWSSTREAWVEGRRREYMRGGEDERGIENKNEVVSEGTGIEKRDVEREGIIVEEKTD